MVVLMGMDESVASVAHGEKFLSYLIGNHLGVIVICVIEGETVLCVKQNWVRWGGSSSNMQLQTGSLHLIALCDMN